MSKVYAKYLSLCLLPVIGFLYSPSVFAQTPLPEAGVPLSLAQERKALLSDIRYTLHFELPAEAVAEVVAKVEIAFKMARQDRLVLDFKEDSQKIRGLWLNGAAVSYEHVNEHIVLDATLLQAGENVLQIDFLAGLQSLNRQPEFLYTLLVPDRARTLFPCFDQPDLKAVYTLSLSMPASWQAVANGKLLKDELLPAEAAAEPSRRRMEFAPTEPLPTYLFSFVAGVWEREHFQKRGREISVYHRETEPLKRKQLDEIAKQVFFCLDWMEDYTGIPYPFAKYDLIILPGFQYGGMEHTGATLYNDKRLILGEHPTTTELFARAELIAHETAHMWFGDYVTMHWFDDVWTKEVFAGYFGNKMASDFYPKYNRGLSRMQTFPIAYSEDRTQGATPIKQPLGNLQDAGLVYGRIIYNKAPIVMDMLAARMGEEALQKGLRQYLRRFAYANADWTELIAILDALSTEDLEAWSRRWVMDKGMPEPGRDWPQEVLHQRTPEGFIIPNVDGRAYGFFSLKPDNLRYCLTHWSSMDDPEQRLSVLYTLHEHLVRGLLPARDFVDALLSYLSKEPEIQVFKSLLQSLRYACKMEVLVLPAVEQELWSLVESHPQMERRQEAARAFMELAVHPWAVAQLQVLWEKGREGLPLSQNDEMKMAYELALRLPEEAAGILQAQRARITHPDKLQEFDFISQAVAADPAQRDAFFRVLLLPENRRVEPWAVSALAYLNHPLRQGQALDYLIPALEILPQIQRTGDIFLPANWCRALLEGHNRPEAALLLRQYLDSHPELPELLKNKVLQNGDFLLRLPEWPVLHGQISYFREKDGLYRSLPILQGDLVLLGDDLIDRGEWTEFFGDKRLKNRGIAIESTDCTRFRVGAIARAQPSKVFIYSGLYDVKQGRSAYLTFLNMKDIVAQIHKYAPDCQVYVMGLLSDAKIAEKPELSVALQEYNALLQQHAASENYTYIDLPVALLSEETGSLAEAYSYNGILLNGPGYIRVTELLAPYLGLEPLAVAKEVPPAVGQSAYHQHRSSILRSLPAKEVDLLMLGNSLTNIGRWDEFFPELSVRNYGISGDGVEGVGLRLDEVIAQQPATLCLMIGVNDFINEADGSVDRVWEMYRGVLLRLQAELPQTRRFVQGCLPLHPLTRFYEGRNAKLLELNERLKVAAAEYGYTYLDTPALFIDSEGNLDVRYTCDGIHLMPQAYALWKAFLREQGVISAGY
jgi:Aminopeptidase N